MGRIDPPRLDSANARYPVRLIIRLFVLALAFTLNVGLAERQDPTVCPSPIGNWSDGGGQTLMSVSETGGVRFDGRLEIYDPGSWELNLSDSEAIVAIRSPGFTPEVLRRLDGVAADQASTASPDRVDTEAKTVFYDLSENACEIHFANQILRQESGPCSRDPRAGRADRPDQRAGRPTARVEARFCHLRTSVWILPAGEAPRTRMLFSANGRIRFEGGFEFYDPTFWDLHVSESGTILAIRSSDFDPEMAAFRYHADAEAFNSAPDSVDVTTRTVYYDLSHDRCHMNFAGWIFDRQSEICNPGAGSDERSSR